MRRVGAIENGAKRGGLLGSYPNGDTGQWACVAREQKPTRRQRNILYTCLFFFRPDNGIKNQNPCLRIYFMKIEVGAITVVTHKTRNAKAVVEPFVLVMK